MGLGWRQTFGLARAWVARRTAPDTMAPATTPGATSRLRCPGAAVFFGYHDKTPFDADGRRVLAHRVEADDQAAATEGMPIDVGYFTLDAESDPVFTPVAQTSAWSWQQGSMLQWDPAAPDRHVLFNIFEDGNALAVVQSIATGQVVERLPMPVYAMSATGAWAISLNFARLARLRPGYGHSRQTDATEADHAPADDGIVLVERGSGDISLLESLRALAAESTAPAGAHHYVNHASFSPDETRVAFFHVWQRTEGPRAIRFVVADRATHTHRVLEADRLVSHYCWLDDGRVLATTRDRALQWRYSTYDVQTGARADLSVAIGVDGHPMRSPCEPRLVVSDTTPDSRRRQHLLLLDIGRSEAREVAAWRTPEGYQGRVRCDLHPRWDRQGTRVCVDSAHEGRREMVILTVAEGA